jgi:GNAT superfamily N-acetyltransferase
MFACQWHPDIPYGKQGEALALMRVRLAGPADAAWLAGLAERTFRETYTEFNTPENMERYVADHFGPDLQAAELRDSGKITLVVEVAGEAAGYAQLARGPTPSGVTGPTPMELVRFYVDRTWHGRGLAQTLMAVTVDTARAAGARTLWLGVWERNGRAIAFYRKSDFEDVGTHTFVLGADPQRDRLLVRRLD